MSLRPRQAHGAASLSLRPALLLAIGLGVFFSGCMHPGLEDSARRGPFFTPTNFAAESHLGGVRRVVLLPLWAPATAVPESVAALDEVVLAALQRENRFEVVTLSREESHRRFGAASLSSSSALPHDLMGILRREFAADAVMFVDLTTFQAYKPLVIAFRAKLSAIDGSRLIWTFDHVFSAEEPAVANSARRHFLDRNQGVPADLSPGVLQSPSRFAEYVSTAMFATLPPVLPPPPKKR